MLMIAKHEDPRQARPAKVIYHPLKVPDHAVSERQCDGVGCDIDTHRAASALLDIPARVKRDPYIWSFFSLSLSPSCETLIRNFQAASIVVSKPTAPVDPPAVPDRRRMNEGQRGWGPGLERGGDGSFATEWCAHPLPPRGGQGQFTCSFGKTNAKRLFRVYYYTFLCSDSKVP